MEEYFKDWLKVIDTSLLKEVIQRIYPLYQTKSIMPEYKNIFKAFTLCELDSLKCVFLGQDPYPQKGVATGIMFGNKRGTKNLSPSLEVLKEAAINPSMPHNPYTFDITLEDWGRQGILLLNSSLTVEEGKPSSHTLLWNKFISSLLRGISKYHTGIIYVLFGQNAQSFSACIGPFNEVIKVKHPAYYARTGTKMPAELFYKINQMVESRCNERINWFNYI